ncbi:hypothetical protein [Celeribacter neptunius]|uniref:Replication initiation factor n=1 Tax=Celeribacter neptunius TaxID=588602 RepID=A0A1I3S6M3_9RHOB|nr:hypothetical protein [Celeribacter neptunius]SFJ54473.1 hypothetical protein SAMN04487991_2357 [Celeribacter neptunius]
MNILHRGFDRLELSIEANIPPELFEYLDPIREEAEDARESRAVSYGGAEFDLLPHGVQGYRFILQSGPLPVTWFFKKPNARDPWGIRIVVGSLMLATRGLGYVRTHIANTLERLGVRYGPRQVSIGRTDFCVDILAPDFELTPENFVIHSHSNRADHLTPEDHTLSNGKSGRFTSVTVGKMPGRQVTIYDKRLEVTDKRKPIWWDIWNETRKAEGLPPLDPKDRSESRIWRVEVRAGKRIMKDRWGITTWEDFDAKFGDVIAEAFEKIRYCEPDPTDTNRARWPNHEIWDIAKVDADEDLTELRSHVGASAVKEVHKADQIKMILALALGNCTTLAALEGVESDDLQGYMQDMGERLRTEIQADPERAANKLSKAKERYRFVG